MYIPPSFEVKDNAKIISFIKEFPFASLVSNGAPAPYATHLPFILHKDEDNKITLYSHIAAINPQCADLQNYKPEVLIIFNGPHGYISPELYENKKTVPTWNYAAVHVYGNINFIEDRNESYAFLQQLITHFEPTFLEKFKKLPQEYTSALMDEIKVFSIKVNKTEACYKLSQNKTRQDQQNIIDKLVKNKDLQAQALANFMAQNLEK